MKGEHGVLPLIRGLYSGIVQQRSHESQWSCNVACCYMPLTALALHEHGIIQEAMALAWEQPSPW